MPRLSCVAVVTLVGVLAAACGATSSDPASAPNNAEGGVGSGDTVLGSSGGLLDGGGGACAASTKDAERATVDVIFVIDSSSSMYEEHLEVKKNINTFAKAIGNTGLDYNVIMIAQKEKVPGPPGGLCVPGPLAGPKCSDGPRFHHLDTDVNSWEALQLILDEFPRYSAWLRPEAYKTFVMVSDDNAQLPSATFDQKLLALSPTHFGDAKTRRYNFNSIVGYKRNTAVLSKEKCSTALNTGENYQQLSQLTGGTVDSVCEASYGSVLDNITKGLIITLGCEFAFPQAAPDSKPTDPTTVVVTYTPPGGAGKPLTQVTDAKKCEANADGWYYDVPSNPTKIMFCPSTCKGPGADSKGKLDISVGCWAPPPK